MSGSNYGYGASNIDTSLALKAGQGAPPPINLLAMASQGQGLQRNALAIQDAQQTLASQNALGRAAQDAINPDGSFNTATFMADVKADPNAQFGAVQGIQQGQTTAGNQYKLNQDALGQANSRIASVGAGMSGLLSNPNLSAQDVINNVAGQSNAGRPVGEFATSVLSSMPMQGQGESQQAYSQRLHGWLSGVVGQSAGPADALHAFTPQTGTVGLGGQTVTMDTNPLTNPNATSTTFRNTLTPEGAATPVPGKVGPNGEQTSISRATYAAQNGLGGLIPGGSPFGDGRGGGLPPALLNPNRSGGAGGGGAPGGGDFGAAGGNGMTGGSTSGPASVAPMVTRLGPGQEAAMRAQGEAAGAQAAALTTQANDIPNRKAMLSDMESDLANAPTGPASQTQNYWSAFANRNFGKLAQYMPWIKSPADVSSYENFEKVTGRFAQSQAQALGGVATGDKLSAATLSNPNVMFSTLGNQGVIHLLQGNEDALNVKNQAWNSYLGGGGDPSKFSQWSSQFNNSGFDPRVFWMKNMTPDERSRTLATFTPSQSAQFYNNMRTALKNGWVSRSDFGSAPASPGAAGGAPDTGPSAVYPTGTGG